MLALAHAHATPLRRLNPSPPHTLTANTIRYAVPGDAMNMFPFVMAYGMDSSSDSDSSTSSSSDSDNDDDDWYLDAMMYVVEEELMHELAHEPEPYHAEPGRPRTLEEGMAKFTPDNFYHFTRFSKEQIRYLLPKIGCPQTIKTAG